MKKFLFTLVALLMASSAFATVEKFTMEGRELAKTELGTTITVPVNAVFEGMVSAFDLEFVCPEGMTVSGHQFKAGRKIHCWMYSEDDDAIMETDFTPALKRQNNKIVGITSTLEVEYEPNGDDFIDCGAVKWKPGTHYMLDIKFDVAANFAGGIVQIITKPTCGNDPREAMGIYPRSTGETSTVDVEFTVEQDTPEQAVMPEIDVAGQYAQTITITGEEGATLYYSLDNVNWTEYTAPFVMDVPGEYTVYAYAVGPNGKTESEHAQKPVVVTAEPAGQAQKPVITVLNDNTTDVTVEIAAEEGATIMYQVTEAGAKAYTAYDAPLHFTTPGTYTIEAYAEGPNGKTESVHATENFTVKAPDQPSQAGDIQVVVNPTTYEVTPTGSNAQIIVDGVAVNLPYVIDRPAYGQGDLNVTITVRTDDGEGFYPVDTPVALVVKEQLPEPNIVATPGQASEDYNPETHEHNNQVDGHYYNVTFEAPAGSTVHYIINGPNGAHFEGNWVAGDDPIHVTVDGTYSVEAYTVDGEDRSTSDFDTFVISPKTGVNELINGKTVASQRFFNLAGQEMTEANGVTIVVTTYTDGTTSAVKVMK